MWCNNRCVAVVKTIRLGFLCSAQTTLTVLRMQVHLLSIWGKRSTRSMLSIIATNIFRMTHCNNSIRETPSSLEKIDRALFITNTIWVKTPRSINRCKTCLVKTRIKAIAVSLQWTLWWLVTKTRTRVPCCSSLTTLSSKIKGILAKLQGYRRRIFLIRCQSSSTRMLNRELDPPVKRGATRIMVSQMKCWTQGCPGVWWCQLSRWRTSSF